jgi:hypothetical protein
MGIGCDLDKLSLPSSSKEDEGSGRHHGCIYCFTVAIANAAAIAIAVAVSVTVAVTICCLPTTYIRYADSRSLLLCSSSLC